MSKRPNDIVREYVFAVATVPPDELTKEGIEEVPEHITQAINEKSSPYLTGFAMGFNMASHIMEALILDSVQAVIGNCESNDLLDAMANRVLRTSSLFKAIEYISCRTLFDRGYIHDGETEDATITVH